jgi:hypothetical protein
MRFKLNVEDADVHVWQQDDGFWKWSFYWKDGSGWKGDWRTTERGAKNEARDYYMYQTGNHTFLRVRWVREP